MDRAEFSTPLPGLIASTRAPRHGHVLPHRQTPAGQPGRGEVSLPQEIRAGHFEEGEAARREETRQLLPPHSPGERFSHHPQPGAHQRRRAREVDPAGLARRPPASTAPGPARPAGSWGRLPSPPGPGASPSAWPDGRAPGRGPVAAPGAGAEPAGRARRRGRPPGRRPPGAPGARPLPDRSCGPRNGAGLPG